VAEKKLKFQYDLSDACIIVTIKGVSTSDEFEMIRSSISTYHGVRDAYWLDSDGRQLCVVFTKDLQRQGHLLERLDLLLRENGVCESALSAV
jgi:hypothetical protein